MPVDQPPDATSQPLLDYLIIGQGLAGSLLAWELIHRSNQRVLVVDNNNPHAASRVAAGLINPITGRRLAKTQSVDIFLPVAESYYGQLEAFFNCQFFHSKPLIRLFRSDSELERYKRRRRDPEYNAYLGDMFLPGMADEPVKDDNGGFMQLRTGYVDIPLLLEKLRSFLQEKHAYLQSTVEPNAIAWSEKHLSWNQYKARELIYCDGADAVINPAFAWLPFQPAKGDILTLKSSEYVPQHILNDGHWLLPIGKPHCRVGTTYQWEWQTLQPQQSDREELLDAYRRITEDDSAQVVEHATAIRPTTKDKYAFLGRHPDNSNMSIFNGFGSKGALTLPFYVQHFARHLQDNDALLDNVNISRFDVTDSPVTVARRLMAKHLELGDIAIDATMGNGNDTLLMASCVGQNGAVLSFDIQDEALANTKKLLSRFGQLEQVQLIKLGHEQMSEVVPEELRQTVSVICFNLGYLPGSDKSIVTHAPTTLIALTKALNYLRPGGAMIVVAYPGHEGGREELVAVRNFSQKLPSEIFGVKRFVCGTDIESAPQLFIFRLVAR